MCRTRLVPASAAALFVVHDAQNLVLRGLNFSGSVSDSGVELGDEKGMSARVCVTQCGDRRLRRVTSFLAMTALSASVNNTSRLLFVLPNSITV